MGGTGRAVEGEKEGSGYFFTGLTLFHFATVLAISVIRHPVRQLLFHSGSSPRLWEHYSLFIRSQGSCHFLLFSPRVFYLPLFNSFNQLFQSNPLDMPSVSCQNPNRIHSSSWTSQIISLTFYFLHL